MTVSRGKQFEAKLKSDFINTVPDSSIDRIYDSVSGFKSISNICDFIAYKYPNIFYIEVKSHKGNTFPIANLTQYSKLKEKAGITGLRAGVVIWFIDHGKVVYVPVRTITAMIHDGKKSVNIKDLGSEKYRLIEIPSVKKRVFLDSDYSVLTDLKEGD